MIRAVFGSTEHRTRLDQILWVVDHLPDLDADFLRFYGIEDMMSLTGTRWLQLAYRVSVYPGVMAARIEAQNADGAQSGPDPARATSAPVARNDWSAFAGVMEVGRA